MPHQDGPRLKGWLATLLIPILLMAAGQPVWAEAPKLVGESAIMIDFDSGDVLYAKNPDKSMYPASTTKVMTALLALETLELDTNVVIDGDTPFTEGSRIYLFEDEVISVRDLLHALLLESANDAAVALAKAVSGDVESFVDAMNRKALALGATGTHFTNPNGLPDKAHVTTVHDMALIARKALENETFKALVQTVRYKIEPTNTQPEPRYLKNGNRLLWGTGSGNQIYYDGEWIDIMDPRVDGVKTGYTTAARQCLVATAAQGGRRVITVVFKSQQKNIYKDTRALIDYGLEAFANRTLAQKGQRMLEADIANGVSPAVTLAAGASLIRTLPASRASASVESLIDLEDDLDAPIAEGQVLGTQTFLLEGEPLGTVPLVAEHAVEKQSLWDGFANHLDAFPLKRVLGGVLLAYLAWRTHVTRRRLKRIRARKNRRTRRFEA